MSATARLGVLAFGDSITNGGGELQWGVALQSWALWVARGLGVPFTTYAVDGARARDVVSAELPAFAARAADPGARYDVGCLYIGVNDVRATDFDPDAFAADQDAALAALAACCDRVLAVTVPENLGRPRAPAGAIAAANRAIEAVARRHGALLLDLRSFGARNLVMADHVHPTAFGQVAIAERALAVLERDGMPPRVRPSTLIAPAERTRWNTLRGDVTYAYRHAKISARAVAVWARVSAARLASSRGRR